MRMRRCAAGVALLAMAILGCSKTQDTAPERRIFGQPPAIEGVSLQGSTTTATCDLTRIVQGYLCSAQITPDLYTFSPGPTVHIEIDYTELQFRVQVTDPESTATTSDVLLVTASYSTPASGGSIPVETSLVLFDDASETTFPYRQGGGAPENCTIDIPNGICGCTGAEYQLNSNDTVKGDGIFSRGFGLVGGSFPSRAQNMINNCIANTKHQAPASATDFIGGNLTFKIEAVDKSGNLAEWPQSEQAAVGTTTFRCLGDECACCLMISSDPSTECSQLPGLPGVPGTGYETGLCKTF